MRSVFFLTTGFIFLSAGLFAKENKDLVRANYYYNHFAFHEAIPYFEKIAEGENSTAVYAQLGDCYRLTGNLQKAADRYAKAVVTKGCKDAVILHYTQVLMELMQYDEAKKWMQKYHESNKTDKRIVNLIAGCESAADRLKAIPGGIAIFLDLNTEGSEFAPTLWKDNLVFTSDTVIDLKKKTDYRTGNSFYNLYSVPCDASGHCGNEYNTVASGNDLNIKYHDGPCTFSADGKEMYFTRSRYNNSFFSKQSIANNDSVVLLEIMIASEYDTGKKRFKKIEPFEYNSKDYSVAHPTVSPNGNMLVFSSNMPHGSGGSDLYICLKSKDKEWLKPVNAGKAINTEGEEVFPYWADNSTLYFSSDGHEGLGGLDIYRTKWDESTHAFSEAENTGTPINSSYDDISLALFADGRSTYFSSNRPAAKGGDNIYFYKKESIFLQLDVTDSMTGQPLTNVNIALEAIPSSYSRDTVANINGKLFTQLYPETPYTIRVSKDGYNTRQIAVNTFSDKDVDTIVRHLTLYAPQAIHDNTMPQDVTNIPLPGESIMDSPGIKKFEVNKVYVIGHFDFNFSKFYFNFNKANLNIDKKIVLDTLTAILNRYPTMRIQVQAHTDCRGTVAYNNKLSLERAQSVVNYLEEKGISPKRLEYKGFGKSQPVIACPDCKSCTEEQHAQNRVLEFKVLQL